MSILAFLAELLLMGTAQSAIIFPIGWLAFASYRPVLRQLIVFSNVLLLSGAVLFLLITLCDFLIQVRSSDEYEQYVLLNRITGPYWFAYWGAVLCKGWLPQLLWFKRLRRSIGAGLALAPFLLVDYWQPVVYSSLHHDYLPSSWAMLRPDYSGLAVASAGYWVVFAAGWLIYRASTAARRQQP